MTETTGTQLADFNFIEWQELYDIEKPYEVFIQLPKGFNQGDRTNLVFKKYTDNVVQDLRARESQFSLDMNGFQIFDLPTSFKQWHDRKAVEKDYMRECAEILRQNLDNVDWIYFYNWRLRDSQTGNLKEKREVNLNNPTDALNPAVYPHIDESDVGSVLRTKAYFGDEAEDLLRGRLRVINMWRPLEPVEDYPLALADARSFTKADLVASDNIRSNFQGETFFGKYTPDYKWYYLSNQKPNEVFIFKIHDSKSDVPAKRTLHAAFKLKNPPVNAKPRRSIEVRALVFSKLPGLEKAFTPSSDRELLYGTAWKKDHTTESTFTAIKMGFRAFDTACQPRSYREDLVGEAIRKGFSCGILRTRDEIWIQSKFTPPTGHDSDTAPYDLTATIPEQVHTSIARSLHNLRHKESLDPLTDEAVYLDSVLLHSPFPDFNDTLLAWRTLSSYVPHRIRAIGVSNMPLSTLRRLYDVEEIKPSFVQNRFTEETGYEIPLRRFCRTRGITFQAFRALKDKSDLLSSMLVGQVAASLQDGISRELALYLLILGLGKYMKIVNGTEIEEQMRKDLAGLAWFKKWVAAEDNSKAWIGYVTQFRDMIGESWSLQS